MKGVLRAVVKTGQEAINPSEQIAGMHSILQGLMGLPYQVAAVNGTDRVLWQSLVSVLPPVPMGEDS